MPFDHADPPQKQKQRRGPRLKGDPVRFVRLVKGRRWHARPFVKGPNHKHKGVRYDLGLFDMLGNVYEWCHNTSRIEDPPRTVDEEETVLVTDPRQHRILCGGSFHDHAYIVRSACINKAPPGAESETVGFRVVRTIR